MAKFEMELIYEPTGDAFTITVDYETDDPEAVVAGYWPDDLTRAIFDDISIVPLSWDVSEEDNDED